MKQYSEDMGGTGDATQGTQGSGADGGATQDGGTAATQVAAPTPAAKTYTQEQVDAYVERRIAARDGAWNQHLLDPEKGLAALQQLAAQHGVKLTEKEKENVADAAATGDDKDLTTREKAMLDRLEKLEGVHKSAEKTQVEKQATAAMQADISHAASLIPYGRSPKYNGLVKDLILAAMIDPETPKGTPTANLAKGIQFALEKTFEEWAKENGYVKDPNAAAGQPLRGGVSQAGVKPNEEPKNFDDVESQTAATLRAMRSARGR